MRLSIKKLIMHKDFSLKNKKVWVAGHNGMVGSALCNRLKKEECNLLTISRSKLDLCRDSDVEDWMKINQPNIVFLAAAKVGGILYNSKKPAEFITENLQIQTNVIKYSHKYDVEKLIFLGSACVYPISEKPIKEDLLLTGKLETTNKAYAVAKIAGIEMCKFYREQYNSNFISVQPNNLYGFKDNFSNQTSHVIPALIGRIHNAKKKGEDKVIIWGSGNPQREFVFIEDLADALVFITKKYNDSAPINIGSGEEITIFELATLIAKVIKFRGKLVFDESFPDGVPRKFLDTSKLKKLGWNPRIKLNEGIKMTYSWYLENIDHENE